MGHQLSYRAHPCMNEYKLTVHYLDCCARPWSGAESNGSCKKQTPTCPLQTSGPASRASNAQCLWLFGFVIFAAGEGKRHTRNCSSTPRTKSNESTRILHAMSFNAR
jgi:hypothetical protein